MHEPPTIGAVVLAAGQSRRMGQFKLLLPWLDERSIVETVVRTLGAVSFAATVVVTGYEAQALKRALSAYPQLQFAHNEHYAQGELLSSLQVGLSALPQQVSAALVLPADLPRIDSQTIHRVLNEAFATPEQIIAPMYQGRRGHPVIFPRRFWAEIQALPPDSAPRAVLRANPQFVRYIQLDTDRILDDVDTPEQYIRVLQRAKSEHRG